MIRVGVAGWDYRDWNGVVYPAAPGARFDRLAWLGRFVDVVEINSTFYRPAAPRVAASWARRVASRERFRFTAKTHRSWTHDENGPTPDDARRTLEGVAPLRDAGRFGALLVQFPQAFRFGPRARDRIDRIAGLLGDWPAVVEVRHASWEDDAAGAWLAARGVGWCVVDQPAPGPSTSRAVERIFGRIAYLRLHGRNAADWFRPGAGRDARYDYLYDRGQVADLAATAARLDRGAEETFVVQNNHFRGQALVNALQMARALTGERPEAPPDLVAAYPFLRDDVRVRETGLF